MLQKCELRRRSSSLSFNIKLEKLVKMKLLNNGATASGMSSNIISDDEKLNKSEADDESLTDTEMDLDEPELNLKLSEDEEEEDDGDDTDIDDDLLNSFTSVLTTPESPVKRLVIDSDVESDMNDTSLVIDTDDDEDDNISDISIISEEEEFKCQICASQFMTEKSLKIHRSQCAKSQKTCEIKSTTHYAAGPVAADPEPEASTSTADAIGSEIIPSQVFPPKKKKTQKCDVCGKLFSQKGSLIRHFETIHKNFQMKKCNICDEIFYKLVELKRHKFNVHGIETPVKLNPNKSVDLDSGKYRIHCDVCDRTFSCVGNLKAHMANVHDANKVHKCEFCDKSFHQSVQLNDHIKQNHGGPKKYKCDYCEKTFDRIGHRNIHVNGVHKKLRDYKCEFCSKTFTTSCNMMKHIRIVHYALKNYNCDFCEKKFSQSSHLKSHLNNVHKGMKIFKCKYCEKSFSRSDHLKSHTISAHQSIKYELSSTSPEFDPVPEFNPLPVPGFNPHPVPILADPISSSSHSHSASSSAPGLIPILAAITSHSPAKNIPNHPTPFFVQQEYLEKYKCDICDIVFITSTHLNDHNKSVHEEQNQKIQTNSDSDSNSNSNSDSILKINSDNAGAPNETVPVEENNSEPNHPRERIILRLKKYNCELCDKSFAVSKDLRRHINAVHEGLKPYTCSFCQNQFSRSDHLKRHISLTHIINGKYASMQIANVTSLANVSGTKLIEKLMNDDDDDEKLTETEINYSSEDDDVALVIDEKKVDIIKKKSEKNDESPDKSSGMTNISEESRPPKRINATATSTTNSMISIPTSHSQCASLETSKSAATTSTTTTSTPSTPTTPYVALQITDVIPMKHVQNNQYVLALKWTKMPNSTSSASTSSSNSSPTTPTPSGSAPQTGNHKPEIIAQSMPIVSEIDEKKVTDAIIPETTAKINQKKVAPHLVPYPGSKAAHVMVSSSGSGLTGSTPDEKKDEPEEEHQARLVPRDLRNDSEKPEGPNEWAGYAHIRGKLPTLAPKPKHGTSASSMYRHLSRIGGSERTCDVCNKTFSDRSYLKVHIKSVHYGTKEHQCKQCEKKFLKQSHLRKHVAGIHEGIKHKCEFCSKIFSASNGRHSLLRHISSVHQGIKFKCNLCERTFNRTDHLKGHMMKSHQCHLDKNNVTVIKAVTNHDNGTSEPSVTYVTETTTIRHYASSKYTVPSSEYIRTSASNRQILAPKLLPLPPSLTPGGLPPTLTPGGVATTSVLALALTSTASEASPSTSTTTSFVPKGTVPGTVPRTLPGTVPQRTISKLVPIRPKPPTSYSSLSTMPSSITMSSIASLPVILQPKTPPKSDTTSIINPVASNIIIDNSTKEINSSTTTIKDLSPIFSTIPNGVASKRITCISIPEEMGNKKEMVNGKLKSLLVGMPAMGSNSSGSAAANEMRQIASITSQAEKYLKKSEKSLKKSENNDDIIKDNINKNGDNLKINDHHILKENEETKKVDNCKLCKDVFGSDHHEFNGCFIP